MKALRLGVPQRLTRRYVHTRREVSSNVIDTLESRGFIAALTNPEIRRHVTRQSCIYGGVDPSAKSLHVGNLVALMGLLHFKLAGHNVLALIGGATGSIGDPSGRSTERTALSPEVLATNVEGITNQVHRFFNRGQEYIARRNGALIGATDSTAHNLSPAAGPEDLGSVTVLNNHDWFKGVSFLDFLRDVGKLAKVNTMIARDSVKSRLNTDNGISFTEFSYQLLQAYDFAHLHKHHACRIQLGGSDQWGNIVAGIDLIKRQQASASAHVSAGLVSADGIGGDAGAGEPAYGLTFPLLTNENGEKFGKSAGNAVWLDGDQTSVHDFYQFFLRLPDGSVEQQLKLFTLLPLERIEEIMHQHETEKGRRVAQKILAEEVTELVHGHEALEKSQNSAKMLYTIPAQQLSSQTVLSQLGHETFFHRVKWSDLQGVSVPKLMISYGLCTGRAEASRLVKGKGVTVSGRRISDPREEISREDVVDGHLVVLRQGKNGHLIFYIEDE